MMQLRRYRSSDLDQLISLFLLNTPAFFCPEEQEGLRHYLQQEVEDYFVIEEDGKLLASGGCNVIESTGRLSWYLVHPDSQGKGLGRQLALHGMQVLRDNPAVQHIEVRTSQLVYPFYEKLGFVLRFTEDNYWGQGMHLYHMDLK